ncbi:MAG: SGNH/GDSL hydrolase family protein [Kiritimatiellia bacterium]
MRAAPCIGLTMVLALAASPAALTKDKRPVEADLFHHLKDALKNPPEETGKPRVLLLGDSISIGYTIAVRKELQGKALVFRPPVNCQHTGYGLANLKKWLGTNTWDVIHFNWGIWDTHLLDARDNLAYTADETTAPWLLHQRYTPEQYAANLEKMVALMRATGARLIWASSTPIMSRKGDQFDDIARLNAAAARVMQKEKVEVNDLYTFVLPNVKSWQSLDQVHFNAAGNIQLGERVGAFIRRALEEKPAAPR